MLDHVLYVHVGIWLNLEILVVMLLLEVHRVELGWIGWRLVRLGLNLVKELL